MPLTERCAVSKAQVPVPDSLVSSGVKEKSPDKNFFENKVKSGLAVKKEDKIGSDELRES